MDILTLRALLENAWSAETAYNSYIYKGDRATGQCCVTALVVQDYLGGRIMRGVVNGGSHFWNKINGIDVDLTWRQFPSGSTLTKIKASSSKEVLLTNKTLKKRYKKLLKLINE